MDTSLFVIGLGNPGVKYSETRHNLGFWVADLLCRRHRGRWTQPSGRYLSSRVKIAGSMVLLVEPQTYMNLSGEALNELSREFSLEPSDLLVICDDLALPLGRLRLRQKGSDGGHNGLLSIAETLGTPRFPRLRLGVGPLPDETDPSDFVLTGFGARDRRIAEQMVTRAADCVEFYVEAGADAAMGRFNAREDGQEPG
jgi:peptidyl-tRNA hydrolase, PTH1 family